MCKPLDLWKTSDGVHCENGDALAAAIFQDCKLYLFFISNKGLPVIELRTKIEDNEKIALLFNRKYRILMAVSKADQIIDKRIKNRREPSADRKTTFRSLENYSLFYFEKVINTEDYRLMWFNTAVGNDRGIT